MMLESAIESPQEPHLSEEMKLYADTKLSEDSTIYPLVLFAFICEKINDGVFCGPPPTQEHVQSYTKRWRAKHRDDTVQLVVEFCAQAMYSSELTEDRTTSDRLIFCDIVEEDGLKVPFVGDGSDSQPMRVGITCYSLLEAYIAVQSDPRCTTVCGVVISRRSLRPSASKDETTFKLLKLQTLGHVAKSDLEVRETRLGHYRRLVGAP
ncbi:hypothetical protein PI125_g23797 [Phytophthora idaei]|nr:hypothetical protein PI125_g23797 [Phytophthora idaei]